MSKEKILKLICAPSTILVTYGDEKLSIKKLDSPKDFKKAVELAEAGDNEGIVTLFFDINERVKKFTEGNFVVKNKQLFLKNSTEVLPSVIAKALIELERAGEDYMPLIRFWRKLSKSSSENSKQQLYSFIVHNKIQITELGDVVLEKGVKQRSGGMPDELVDDRTGTIDHSIGSFVSMPREKVEDNPNVTCASGLMCSPLIQ